VSKLPLERTDAPGIYRRGSKYVVVYRAEGRQRKQYAHTRAEARAIKLERDGEARALRRVPTLHGFSLSWLDRYAGTGHDSVRANTRVEYRRLLVNFALTYFDREVRVRDLDRAAVQHFVDWLTTRPGRAGRLCDRSIANALTPLRLALDAAVAKGLLDANPAEHVVLPRRRAGRAWSTPERRFLTRAELVRLIDEVPAKWRPLFELLAATGRARAGNAGAAVLVLARMRTGSSVGDAAGLTWTRNVVRCRGCSAVGSRPATGRDPGLGTARANRPRSGQAGHQAIHAATARRRATRTRLLKTRRARGARQPGWPYARHRV
jgi:hypothetical protein